MLISEHIPKRLLLLGFYSSFMLVALVSLLTFASDSAEALDVWGWQYVLRQSGHNRVWLKAEHDWRSLHSLAVCGGSVGWYPHSVLTRESAYPTHLITLWKQTFKEPRLLATNIHCPALAPLGNLRPLSVQPSYRFPGGSASVLRIIHGAV